MLSQEGCLYIVGSADLQNRSRSRDALRRKEAA